MADESYSLSMNGQNEGPFPLAELIARQKSGALDPSAFLWDGAAWVNAAEFIAAKTATAAKLPPPPPPPPPPPQAILDAPPMSVAPSAATKPEAAPAKNVAPRKRKGMRVAAFLLVILALVGGAAAGALYYWVKIATPLEFSSVLPPGALFYQETNALEFTPEQKKTYDDFTAYLKAKLDVKTEPLALEAVAARTATAMYIKGSGKLEPPATVTIYELRDPAAAEPLIQKLKELFGFKDAATKDLRDWKVEEVQKPVYMAWAAKKKLRVFATNKQVLDETLELIDGVRSDALRGSAAFREAFAITDDGSFAEQASLSRLVIPKSINEILKGPPAGPDRFFVDLEACVKLIPRELAMYGGETFKKFKADYLDPLKYIVSTPKRDASGINVEMRIVLKKTLPALDKISQQGLESPGCFSSDAMIKLAVGLSPEWVDALGGSLDKMLASRGQARIGKVMGQMGSVNGALSMYFADNAGKFPKVKTPTPLSKIGLIPKYLNADFLTPWGEEYVYVGNGKMYTLTAEKSGATIVTYSSETGRIEKSDSAVETISEGGISAEKLKELLAGIREVGFAVDLPEEGMPLPKFSALIRCASADAAKELVDSGGVVEMMSGMGMVSVEGEWIVGASPDLMAGIRAALEKKSPAAKNFFAMDMNLPLRKLLKDDKAPDASWKIHYAATTAGQEIKINCRISPDPSPAAAALVLTGMNSDKFKSLVQILAAGRTGMLGFPGLPARNNFRHGSGRGRGTPANDFRATPDDVGAEQMGRNQAALSAGIY